MIVNISVGLGLITDGSIAVCYSLPANTANLDTKKQSYQPPLASIMQSGINIENMTQDEIKQLNNVRELVLKQVDTIIEKYTPEIGEKFFTNDIYVYLLTVGSGMVAEGTSEYYQFPNKGLAERLYKSFIQEAKWYPKHCTAYCNATIIKQRLSKFRARIEKIFAPSKQTQAERNAEFQKTVVDLLTQILEVIK